MISVQIFLTTRWWQIGYGQFPLKVYHLYLGPIHLELDLDLLIFPELQPWLERRNISAESRNG